MRSVLLFLLILLTYSTLVATEHEYVKISDKFKHFTDQYCVSCHGAKKQKGKFRVDTIDLEFKNGSIAQNWQDVLDVLNLGEMPPDDIKNYPSKDELSDAIDELTVAVRDARNNLSDSGGRPIIRRLNKREIGISLEELLGVAIHTEILPDDDKVEGFDTHGGALTMSSLFIQNLSEIIDDALNRVQAAVHHPVKTHRTDYKNNLVYAKEEYEKYRILIEQGKVRNSDLSEEEVARLTPNELLSYENLMYRNWSKFRFPEAATGRLISPYQRPNLASANFLNLPEGKYKISLKVANVGEAKLQGSYMIVRRKSRDGQHHLSGENYRYFDINGTFQQPQVISFEYDHRKDLPEELMFHMRSDLPMKIRDIRKVMGIDSSKISQQDKDSDLRKEQIKRSINIYVPDRAIWVDYVQIEGPFSEANNKFDEIFFDGLNKQSDKYARRIIDRFSQRALRGKNIEPEFLDDLFTVYKFSRDNGRDFERSIKDSFITLLTSPQYLYLVESSEGGKAPISDLELANRMSIFLWSSKPDGELLELSKNNKLRANLDKQIRRMLLSPKADVFFTNFVEQWLELKRISDHKFAYVEFDKVAIDSALQEPVEFFKTLVRSNLGLDNILNSEFIVINSVLAQLYGIDGLEGMNFRRVDLPQGSVRGGILAQAGVLAKLSDGHRNLTIERGAFVLRKFLDNPPASPPPNVPLPNFKGKYSTRKILELHKEDPACASCHRRIDPIGFGLENFNAIGLWRDSEIPYNGKKPNSRNLPSVFETLNSTKGKVKIDSKGVLDGHEFSTFFELREMMAENYTENLISGLSKALINYGVGRTPSFTDRPIIEQLISKSGSDDYKAMDFMIDFIKSDIFTYK